MLVGIDEVREIVNRIEMRPDALFAGPRPEGLILTAESRLGIRFPLAYREFLARLGAGSIGAFEVYGVVTDEFDKSSVPDGVLVTMVAREHWLPESFVIVGNSGHGGHYALDLADGDDQDAPVVLLLGDSTAGTYLSEPTNPSFTDYLARGVEAAIGPE